MLNARIPDALKSDSTKRYVIRDTGSPQSVTGLELVVHAGGKKTWSFRYRFGAVHRRLTLGSYPEVGWRRAREDARTKRDLLRQDIDPAIKRKAAREAMLFDTLAED